MDGKAYRTLATRTWKEPLRGTKQGIEYLFHGLASEVGEISAVRKRQIRDDISPKLFRAKLVLELGDALWYLDRIAEEHGISMDEIQNRNIDKLSDRAERGAIKGEGDDR